MHTFSGSITIKNSWSFITWR